MQDSISQRLLQRVAEAEPIRSKLRELKGRSGQVRFSHVTEAAQSLLVAALASEIPRTLWIVCPTVRTQETFYETLLNWQSDALFLPEAEFAAVENILPDPEITAERLALLSRILSERGPHIIVVTRASLDQPAHRLRALKSAALRIKKGSNQTM